MAPHHPSQFHYTPASSSHFHPNVLFEEDWPSAAPERSVTPNSTSTSRPDLGQVPTMPSTHFLSLARNPTIGSSTVTSTSTTSDGLSGPVLVRRGVDTSTTSAADFDVDAKTGFMPTRSPIVLLPGELGAVWERVLSTAIEGGGLTLGQYVESRTQAEKNAQWRKTVDEMPVLSIAPIRHSEVYLRRAHHVLTFILHFYIHSQLPLTGPGPHPPQRIPPCLAIPLVELSKELVMPPILTYADNVLYNWSLNDPTQPLSVDNVKMVNTFSGTQSERHFYITSARIELRGVEALELMKSCMDEAFIGDTISLQRIVGYLHRLSIVIDDMAVLLMAVRDECDPHEFYTQIRPWFNGWSPGAREWLFEGVDEEDQAKFATLSGPSAGQSSLIHALDVFLGVDHTKPETAPSFPSSSTAGSPSKARSGSDPTFLMKMEQYMPRHHRAFLQHLRAANQTHVRALVAANVSSGSVGVSLQAAYDEAVMALKRFRDGHIRIATLYIVSQARKNARPSASAGNETKPNPPVLEEVRGTGGTSLVPFLKECRDNTAKTALGSGPGQ
ncbi:hypothetical protein M407DRAFT_16472 [Tulasnella calospora MUT 4182]|uniref:Indoleamine 2,3-dioxygenase n=1 Tax=Tulasnella calospora MUT 4182 TaxID=1051891 RepID=A0A0C3QMZ5_9AGAM|nr:hypothetical protein M407DRAFT_16472 [Tulasnella calospora MUT 4182]